MVVLGVTPHKRIFPSFFVYFFCVFFLIFKFSTKKGFIQSKANGLGFDPQWRYLTYQTFDDNVGGASIAQSVERSPLKFLSAAACACAFGFFCTIIAHSVSTKAFALFFSSDDNDSKKKKNVI